MLLSFGRQCSSAFTAEGGGRWPSMASRASRPSTSGSGACSVSARSSRFREATRASSAASRLIATPAIACAPSTSHRVCSRALNTCRAWALRGTCRAWNVASWWRSFSAAESAWPRARTTCWYGRDGSGRSIRTVFPATPGFSVTNSTSISPVRPIARVTAPVARRSPSRASLVRLEPCFSSVAIVYAACAVVRSSRLPGRSRSEAEPGWRSQCGCGAVPCIHVSVTLTPVSGSSVPKQRW